ncbi:MAG: murein peptide amidase A [Acidobacteria bacterium]|nr:MAG: murein peptide amidase A [Acidobacteriota bacterium]
MRPRKERGTLQWVPRIYGQSVLGCPLEVWLPAKECKVLIFAGIHGEEAESTFLISRTLRLLSEPSPHCAVILAANPDGLIRGTRCNANGVELNRNFPTKTWSAEPVPHRSSMTSPRDILLSPGTHPASEPETSELIKLIQQLQPDTAIAMHAPLDCIEDPENTPLARWFARETGMELIEDVGYKTPGSFGTWCSENGIHVITYELPLLGPSTIVERQSPVFYTLLTCDDFGTGDFLEITS